MFWLDAAPLRAAELHVAAVPVVAAPVGTPLAFIVPAGFPQPMLPVDNALTHEGVALGRQLFSTAGFRVTTASRARVVMIHARP